MTFILISGSENVGKTHVCNRVHSMLDMNGTFVLRDRTCTVRPDHITHYEKGGKHIVMNSPSDDDRCMLDFAKYLDSLAKDGVRPEIIITTIRDSGEPMSRMLALLEKVAGGTANLEDYYKQNIAGKSSSDLAPASLCHHAFVLHLEKQDFVGDEVKALKPYWDDNADKVKYALDFALARL